MFLRCCSSRSASSPWCSRRSCSSSARGQLADDHRRRHVHVARAVHVSLRGARRRTSARYRCPVLQAQVVFTVAIAAVVLRERPHPQQVVGVFVGVIGLVLVGLGRGGDVAITVLGLCLLGALSWGSATWCRAVGRHRWVVAHRVVGTDGPAPRACSPLSSTVRRRWRRASVRPWRSAVSTLYTSDWRRSSAMASSTPCLHDTSRPRSSHSCSSLPWWR
ncbi:MAG: EamA family transporter [Acidimicrobiales bacterium]